MKKISWIIVGLGVLLPSLIHAQEVAERVTLESVPAPLNVVLEWPSNQTRWLLKLKPGCPTLQAGAQVQLGVRGALNGRNDYLDLSLSRRCEIKEAFEFNEVLTVNSTNRNRAEVTDEQGRQFTIFNNEGCGDLLNYVQEKVYVRRFGLELAPGDKVFVPGEPRTCYIRVVERVTGAEPRLTVQSGDHTVPTRVTHVRAIPRKGKAFLYWRGARDNIGVDHYIVSFSKDRYDPKHLEHDSAPNQFTVQRTHTTVPNLENDTDYWFYVLAVDAAGNKSTFWSDPGHARVLSSISPDPEKQTGQGRLLLRKVHESERSILFNWAEPPTATRYLVTLRADGKLEFSFDAYTTTYIRIAKLSSRRGKTLELTVSAFNPRGFIGQEKIEFEF